MASPPKVKTSPTQSAAVVGAPLSFQISFPSLRGQASLPPTSPSEVFWEAVAASDEHEHSLFFHRSSKYKLFLSWERQTSLADQQKFLSSLSAKDILKALKDPDYGLSANACLWMLEKHLRHPGWMNGFPLKDAFDFFEELESSEVSEFAIQAKTKLFLDEIKSTPQKSLKKEAKKIVEFLSYNLSFMEGNGKIKGSADLAQKCVFHCFSALFERNPEIAHESCLDFLSQAPEVWLPVISPSLEKAAHSTPHAQKIASDLSQAITSQAAARQIVSILQKNIKPGAPSSASDTKLLSSLKKEFEKITVKPDLVSKMDDLGHHVKTLLLAVDPVVCDGLTQYLKTNKGWAARDVFLFTPTPKDLCAMLNNGLRAGTSSNATSRSLAEFQSRLKSMEACPDFTPEIWTQSALAFSESILNADIWDSKGLDATTRVLKLVAKSKVLPMFLKNTSSVPKSMDFDAWLERPFSHLSFNKMSAITSKLIQSPKGQAFLSQLDLLHDSVRLSVVMNIEALLQKPISKLDRPKIACVPANSKKELDKVVASLRKEMDDEYNEYINVLVHRIAAESQNGLMVATSGAAGHSPSSRPARKM